MNKVHYSEPSMEGMGLPGAHVDAFSSMAGSIHELTSQINRALKDSRVVYLSGQGRVPLDDALRNLVPAGTVAGFHGTVSQARGLRGWRVCDGGSGTPDLLGKVLKFVAEGTQASGETGGADTHVHTAGGSATTENNAGITVDNENAHTHAKGTLATSACGLFCTFCLIGGVLGLACANHTHAITGSTAAGSAHSHGLTGDPHVHDIAASFSLLSASNWPPYWEGIPIIKL